MKFKSFPASQFVSLRIVLVQGSNVRVGQGDLSHSADLPHNAAAGLQGSWDSKS